MAKSEWPAPERNKQPILEVLERVLPPSGLLLEIASGSGQHAVFFGSHLPGFIIQPTDIDPENLKSISAWVDEAQLPNVRRPLRLDVMSPDWGVLRADVIYCANMIHIAPFACAEALVAGVGRHLSPHGVFVLYGPFRVGGEHTAPSNAAFDAGLRSKDPRFGVRDLEAVVKLAAESGLSLRERAELPANNLCLVFARDAAPAAPERAPAAH